MEIPNGLPIAIAHGHCHCQFQMPNCIQDKQVGKERLPSSMLFLTYIIAVFYSKTLVFSMILNDALAFQNSVFHGKVLVGAPFMKQQYKPTIANLVFHWKVLVGMPLLKQQYQPIICSRMGKWCSTAAATPFPHGRQNGTLTHTSPWWSESLALTANHKIQLQTANSEVKP